MIYYRYTCNILQQKVSRCLRSLKRVLCRWRDPGAQELLPNTVSYVRKCCKEVMYALDDVRCVFDGWIVIGSLKQMIRIIIASQPRSVHDWSDKRYSKILISFWSHRYRHQFPQIEIGWQVVQTQDTNLVQSLFRMTWPECSFLWPFGWLDGLHSIHMLHVWLHTLAHC